VSDEQPYVPYSYRKRLQEPLPMRHGELPDKVRVQFLLLARDFSGKPEREGPYGTFGPANMWTHICDRTAFFVGEPSLGYNDFDGFSRHLRSESVEHALDAIEIALRIMDGVSTADERDDVRPFFENFGAVLNYADIVSMTNDCFSWEGLGYRYVERVIADIESDYIYNEVTMPAVQLLAAANYKAAIDEFLDAHEAARKDDFSGAVVKANNAFESTLKLICDENGWDHGQRDSASTLLKKILSKSEVPDYLASHFGVLRATLESGLPEVRHNNGGHGVLFRRAPVDRTMANYALHLAATNIVFLIETFSPKPNE